MPGGKINAFVNKAVVFDLEFLRRFAIGSAKGASVGQLAVTWKMTEFALLGGRKMLP